MANRPQLFAFLDRLLTNIDPAYAENNLNFTGHQPGQVIQSKISNTLQLVNGLWDTYFDYHSVRTDDQLDTSTDQRWSTTKLSYPTAVSVVAGPGASPLTNAVYFFEGYRVEIDECILAPNGADPLLRPNVPTPGRIWIYLNTGIIADPTQPFAKIDIEDVAAGTPENPGAGRLALVGLDVSVIGEISANVYPASEPEEELRLGLRLGRHIGKTRFEDTATFSKIGSVAAIVEGTTQLVGAAISALAATNNSASPTATFTNTGGKAVTATGDDGSSGALEASNIGAGPSVLATKTVAGSAVKADALVAGGTAVEAEGTDFGVNATSAAGSAVRGSTATGIGIEALSTGSANALIATGGPSAASRAASLVAGDPGATTLLSVTDAGATTSAVAVQGTANAAGTGVRGLGLDGYGVVAGSDSTTPTRSALRIEPQDADPSSPAQGDVYFNDNRGGSGIPRCYTASWRSLHATPKGYVSAFGAAAAGGPIAGGSGNISLVQITPEEIGDVLLVSTGSLTFSSDTGFCTVAVWDLTAAVQVATQVERAIDTDLGGNNTRSYILRTPYTLPDASTRTFATVLTAGAGTITYTLVVTTTGGVQ